LLFTNSDSHRYVVAPTSHQVGYNTHEKPDHHLQLDFVYGYRAHDSR
jgi:hypothetical protein